MGKGDKMCPICKIPYPCDCGPLAIPPAYTRWSGEQFLSLIGVR